MYSKYGERQQPEPALRGPKISGSLARRLTVWYMSWYLALACVVTAFYFVGLARGFARVDDDLLWEKIQVLSRVLRQGKASSAQLGWEVGSESEGVQSRHFYARVLDGRGKPVVQTPGMAQLLPPEAFPAATDSEERGSILVKDPSGRVFGLMAAAVTGSRPDEKWMVQVAYDRTSLEAALGRHESMMAAVIAIVCLVALALGHRIVRRGFRPLREMAEATRQIRGTNLSQRVNLKDPDPELASLAESFNEMLDRLDESFKQISRFSADISHELRTPLTNLRGEAEVALSKERPAEHYRDVLISSLEEYEHLSGIIDRLFFLALAERSEGCLERRMVDVGNELGSIAVYYEPAATEMNLCIELAVNGDLNMHADPVLVRRAVSNLVSNAIAHTPPGGTVMLAAYKQKASIRVIVADSGAGIPAEHLPHVFERFYRVDRGLRGRWGGAGLGLSIVKTVMDLHKGAVEISSAPGHGTSVILEFPLVTNS